MPAAKRTTAKTTEEDAGATTASTTADEVADEPADEPESGAEPVGSGVAVPQVNEDGEQEYPAVSEELELSDDIDDNDALGDKTAEEAWPEGATPAGVPEDLPLYPGETISDTQTTGDVTWWHTSEGRWLARARASATTPPP